MLQHRRASRQAHVVRTPGATAAACWGCRATPPPRWSAPNSSCARCCSPGRAPTPPSRSAPVRLARAARRRPARASTGCARANCRCWTMARPAAPTQVFPDQDSSLVNGAGRRRRPDPPPRRRSRHAGRRPGRSPGAGAPLAGGPRLAQSPCPQALTASGREAGMTYTRLATPGRRTPGGEGP